MSLLKEEIKSKFHNVKFDYLLSRITSFRIGGPAEFYVEVKDLESLIYIIRFSQDNNLPFFIIGNGTNLLISDEGIKGFVVRLKGDFERITIDDGIVEAGAGLNLNYFVKRMAEEEFSGHEFLIGIPGTIGGATVLNAGAHDGCISDIISSVRILDMRKLEEKELERKNINFSYRYSNLGENIITSVKFNLQKEKKEKIIEKINQYMSYKLKTQPLDYPSAGCIFKNPSNLKAAELIEKAGLKNCRIGDACVSEKHANFVVNLGNAKFQDVYQLILLIKDRVKEKFGVDLELEIKIIS